ncbi:beta-glucosidase 17-like [Morus notabilis]|uniref:beta-glucosidase 17-like n=1 Tax=Morus notabilis TaxID=981085 RepID=UPI000CED4D6F|nr:beta-glucosidase 17-like [Morus notabilis]
METHQNLSLLLLFVPYLLACSVAQLDRGISRSDFPLDFIFGASSAAYQYEGAADIGGRKPSIWDTFTENYPEKIADRSSGKVAEEFYYRYESDILRLKKTGFNSFRFSISWSRVLPNGRGQPNLDGIKFYKSLLETLNRNGIKPVVTLFHWDLPQALEDEYGGFLSPKFVDDYLAYVDFCFRTFGHYVKSWITFNEPVIFTTKAYEFGVFAPGRCSHYNGNCTNGNSATEPYIVIHHLILAHAKAVDLYRKKYKELQKGNIGITIQSLWVVPKFRTPESCLAAYRALDFSLGWVFHPITFGDYSEIMKSLVGCRLPKFTEDESKLIKKSYDFLGLNYYTARYAEDSNVSCVINQGPYGDSRVNLTDSKDGVPIGQKIDGTWMNVYPQGIEELVLYIKENYNNPPIYITENGVPDPINSTSLNDVGRIDYYRSHLQHLLKAIKAGANVKGFYIWTFLDDFEWNSGYTYKFGIYHIDRKNNLTRIPKRSVEWFREFFKTIPRVMNIHEEPITSSFLTAA